MATEGAGLYLYRRNSKVIHIKRANFVEERGYIVCLFGAHPRHVLWLEQGQLHSLDLRTAKVCCIICSWQSEHSHSQGGHYSLDWTTGLTFDLKCSIYMKY